MSSPLNIKFTVKDRDENGTTWTLSIPSVQGAFDLDIEGYFIHHEKARYASCWDLTNFHTSNGQAATALEIEKLLGNECRDRATDILNEILDPIMENDFDLWEQNLEAEQNDARNEERLNNAHFRRSAGF